VAGTANGPARRTCRRDRGAPGLSAACHSGPDTRPGQASSQPTNRRRPTGPGSGRRTRCRALAVHGRARLVPARGRLPRGSRVRASSAKRPRAVRAPRAFTNRSAPDRALMRRSQSQAQPAMPPGRRHRSTRRKPGIRDRGKGKGGRPARRHRGTPDRTSLGPPRAGRNNRMRVRRPTGSRVQGRTGSHRVTSPARSGRPPKYRDSRHPHQDLARVRAAGLASTRSTCGQGSRSPAGKVPTGRVPTGVIPSGRGRGRRPGQVRAPMGRRGKRGRLVRRDTGKRNPGKGQPASGRVNSLPDSRVPAGSGQSKVPGRPTEVRSVKASPVRISSVRAKPP
jgi:hypothetical protein